MKKKLIKHKMNQTNTYDKNNRLIHILLEESVNSEGSRYYEYEHIIKYDDKGNEIYKKVWRPKDNFIIDDYITEYDDKGNEIHCKGISCEDEFEFWATYDNDGNEIHYRNSNGFKTEYIYENNLLIKKINNTTDIIEYKYDSAGRLIEEKNDEYIEIINYLNESLKQIISYCTEDSNGKYELDVYDKNDNIIVHEEYENYILKFGNYNTYDKNNNLVYCKDKEGNITDQYVYDNNNSLLLYKNTNEYTFFKNDDHGNHVYSYCMYHNTYLDQYEEISCNFINIYKD